ncbi:hypothetical protein CVO91_08120 [Streptococcus suis]|nr:hypothetical protein CVO91_08120 [Streptococcus suis]
MQLTLEMGAGKNSTKIKRVRLPTPAQLIRPDLECKTRTNLPINHCAEMLTRTLSSGPGLFAQPLLFRFQMPNIFVVLLNSTV